MNTANDRILTIGQYLWVSTGLNFECCGNIWYVPQIVLLIFRFLWNTDLVDACDPSVQAVVLCARVTSDVPGDSASAAPCLLSIEVHRFLCFIHTTVSGAVKLHV